MAKSKREIMKEVEEIIPSLRQDRLTAILIEIITDIRDSLENIPASRGPLDAGSGSRIRRQEMDAFGKRKGKVKCLYEMPDGKKVKERDKG